MIAETTATPATPRRARSPAFIRRHPDREHGEGRSIHDAVEDGGAEGSAHRGFVGLGRTGPTPHSPTRHWPRLPLPPPPRTRSLHDGLRPENRSCDLRRWIVSPNVDSIDLTRRAYSGSSLREMGPSGDERVRGFPCARLAPLLRRSRRLVPELHEGDTSFDGRSDRCQTDAPRALRRRDEIDASQQASVARE